MKKLLIILSILNALAFSVFAQIPAKISVGIIKAEDERRFDRTLEDLLKNKDAKIRARAALAAGRIGDERAVLLLTNLLENDSDEVKTMAAFALGEIESATAADAILKNLQAQNTSDAVRARLIEAAGKIAAANPKDGKSAALGEAILDALDAETKKTKTDNLTVLLGLTAILRAKPEEGDFIAAKFLTSVDARIRADAANTLSRLRAKNFNEPLRAMLLADDDAVARANAARALGTAEDKDAFEMLLEAAATDEDECVRISAIRSLGNLKNAKAADKLLERGAVLLTAFKKTKFRKPSEKNELLEIAATLGRILPRTDDARAVKFLDDLHEADKYSSPETEIALARIAPKIYLDSIANESHEIFETDWQSSAAAAQALAEIANLEPSAENDLLKSKVRLILVQVIGEWSDSSPQIKAQNTLSLAIPEVIRAFAAFKSANAAAIFRPLLETEPDVFIRAALAELIGDLPPSVENVKALDQAFDNALLNDKQFNDAQLAILDALQKQGAPRGALLLALKESDYLVRQKAVQIIKANDLTKTDAALKIQFDDLERNRNTLKLFGASSRSKLGVILNSNADYLRAVSRKNAKAILTTEKGIFTIEFTPEDAPLTVENFIKLAKANYFNGLMIHRVVPNFVMQDGDPRGDGNGGPGWEIRCEINMLPYERGAIGMALSGKDTGGSQWFAAHSPQPHLDGGYTVFGRVNETDMKIVDNLTRGDKILTVKIVEGNIAPKIRKTRK